MALPASDNFNRSDEDLQVSANWTEEFDSNTTTNLAIVSNQLKADSDNQWACCYWSADAFDASHWSSLVAVNDNASGGPAVRVDSGDCYYLDNSGTTLKIYHYNSASFDELDSITDDYTASSTYKLEATDEGGGVTRLKVYEDGSPLAGLNVTDSSLSGGSGGVFIYDIDLILDDWNGGDVAAGTNVLATTDALTLTEQTAAVNAETNIQAGVGSLALTEYSATISITADVNVLATTDALTLTEQQATVNAETNVQATVDALTLTEYAATVTLVTGVNVLANTDALTLTENTATVNAARNVQASTDSLTLTEYSASIDLGAKAVQIDGANQQEIASNYGDITLYFNGSNYYTI